MSGIGRGSGQQPDAVRLAHAAVVGGKGAALCLQQRLGHGMPAALDVEARVAGQRLLRIFAGPVTAVTRRRTATTAGCRVRRRTFGMPALWRG